VLGADAARALLVHPWPLNVRELERCLQAAVVLAGDGPIELRHLPPSVAGSLAEPRPQGGSGAAGLAEPDRRRREEIVAALRGSGGNVTAAARVLGKARVQVQRWMKRYRIVRGEFHS
jgi:transcriptional regulator of acetoin/glycerol metabolism